MDENKQHEIVSELSEEDKLRLSEVERKAKIRFRIKWVLIFIMAVTIFITIDLERTFYHESVHEAIFNNYGISSEKGYDFFSSFMVITFYVQPDREDYISRCDTTCKALQLENEIFSYNISYVYYAIWGVLFILLLKAYLEDYTDYEKILLYGGKI